MTVRSYTVIMKRDCGQRSVATVGIKVTYECDKNGGRTDWKRLLLR